MATTTRRVPSAALEQAKPIAAEVLAALQPAWEPTGHPRRPDSGHYEIAVSSLARLDAILRQQANLRLARNDGDHPDRPGELNGGRQLFYVRGNVLTRVKTRGTGMRQRPHVTISMVDVRGDGDADWHTWDRERAKFTADGHPVWKNLGDGGEARRAEDQARKEGKEPKEFKYSFPTRIVGGLTHGQRDAWADDCHFDLPAGFDASGETTLRPS